MEKKKGRTDFKCLKEKREGKKGPVKITLKMQGSCKTVVAKKTVRQA